MRPRLIIYGALLLLPACTMAQTTTTTVKTSPSDRDYYQQLYDAGGFTHEVISTAPDGSKTAHGRLRDTDYVCLSDNAYSGTFFSFTAHAYDENYSKAGDILKKRPGSDEFLKQYKTGGPARSALC